MRESPEHRAVRSGAAETAFVAQASQPAGIGFFYVRVEERPFRAASSTGNSTGL